MSSYRNEIITGDALTVLKSMPNNHVQMICTSPPYFGLRNYGIDGQIGLEETMQEYIAKVVEVFREARRVLRHDGLLFLNLGDSYSGSGKGAGGKQEYLHLSIPHGTKSDLAPKNLMMIPARVAIALQEDGWYLRSDIIWHKVNAMPESVTDRPTNAHEHIFLLAKSERYFYDADSIREPAVKGSANAGMRNYRPYAVGGRLAAGQTEQEASDGRNKRNVWSVASQPYPESHFATFPPKLIEPCILAGSRPGDIVLDCFMGAGTTALVAIQHGRDYLGIELNPKYVQFIENRIGHVQQNLWSLVDDEVAV